MNSAEHRVYALAAGTAVSILASSLMLCSIAPIVYSQGISPAEAEKNLWVADGLRVSLFAHEPAVRQPIFVQCDDRGRLWTIQYLQYPNPAGLTRVQVDRWSRTIYDRIPEPPPHGPRGRDRITILEDVDLDGHAEKLKDFVDGLNLVTGVAFGHGGVYVLNVPYLLFYPDRNRDDVPDADPEVLLQGFGMEDAQSFSNHLTWGPDGWLYGVNGSTTTCRIRGIEFQQGVWRFHPRRNEFELFCEGGANCYGLTFDGYGNLFYSTNGGPFVHAIEGGYFYKSFGKHGPLHNPYAYHFFPPLDCDQAPGGPPTGGTIYRGELLPERYRNAFLAGNFLGHTASSWRIEPLGSTVRARFAGAFFDARDSWSGPTDLCVGPDGAIYIADFFDQRTAHPDPDAHWDDRNGRIYRIDVPSVDPEVIGDVRELSTARLVALATGSNSWLADRARVELAYRGDRSELQNLDSIAMHHADPLTVLKCLWTRYVIDGLPDSISIKLLDYPNEYVRAWTVRLVTDDGRLSSEMALALAKRAASEESLVVRAAMAAAAKRLPAAMALPIVWSLLTRQDILPDERVEWSMWWAVEKYAISDPELIWRWAVKNHDTGSPASSRLVNLLIRRMAAEGRVGTYDFCARLLALQSQSDQDATKRALRDGLAERAIHPAGIGQGGLFEAVAVPENVNARAAARHFEPLSGALLEYINELWRQARNDELLLELALQAEISEAYAHLQRILSDASIDDPLIDSMLALSARFGRSDLTPVLLNLFRQQDYESRQLLLIDALSRVSVEDLSSPLLESYQRQSIAVRKRIHEVLIARPDSCLSLLQLVDRGDLETAALHTTHLSRVALHNNAQLDALVRKHWGNIGPGTADEKLATMRRFSNDLRAAKGDIESGKTVFASACGTCHKLFGSGGSIGPDLTSTSRHDQASLLASLVDPNAVVRREYLSYIARTYSGNVYVGLLAERDEASVTLLDAENRRTRIANEDLAELRASPVSLMPERVLEKLSPQQLRDLFAYLQQ